jgi:putative oxidoreductase
MRLHVAEVLLALVFVLGGLSAWRNPHPRAAQLAKFRLPLPAVLVRLNAAVMLLAGAALALNIEAALASAVLAIVLVPTTVAGHAFWTADGNARHEQLAHFITSRCLAAWWQ